MKKFLFILIAVLAAASAVTAEKLADLPDVSTPENIIVHGDRFYVLEKANAYVYSIKDFKRLKHFIKPGEGPSEAKGFLKLKVIPDALTVSATGKIMFFSQDGVFKNEQRAPGGISFIYPLGDKFISVKHNTDGEKKIQYMSIDILDKGLNSVKMLRKGPDHELFTRDGKKKRLKVIHNYLGYEVYKDKIYVADSQNGLSITVFDTGGNQLFEIDKEYKKIKVPQSFKDNYMNRLKKSPMWPRLKNAMVFVFREYYPAIYSFWVDSERIYVLTRETKEQSGDENLLGERVLMILDLKGNLIKQVFVPNVDATRCSLDNGKFYYLFENEESEMYELHAYALK